MKPEIVVASMELNDIPLVIEGHVRYHVECNYGADADNKRGIKRTFVDEVVNIAAHDMDYAEVFLNENDKQIAVELLTRKFLEG